MAGCRREAAAPPSAPPKVTVAHPERRQVLEYWEFPGQLEAVDKVEIRARVRGYLKTIHFKEGSEVAKGAVLYEIDPSEYEAAVAKAKADLLKQKAQLRLARQDEIRAEELRASRSIAEEEYQTRVAATDTAAASVKQAQATLRLAEIQLSYTKVRSPITGRVSRTLVTEGNLVGYNEPTLLTTVMSLDPIYVYFQASEREYLEYQRMIRERGAPTAEQGHVPIEIGLATEKGFPHTGVIDFRDNRVDPDTGTIELRGTIPNPHHVLTPGLFARVRVPIGAPRPRLLIPQSALSTDQRGPFVLVVASDGTVHVRKVEPGQLLEDGLLVIRTGLNANDRVIVNGLQRAHPGTKVDAEFGPPPRPG